MNLENIDRISRLKILNESISKNATEVSRFKIELDIEQETAEVLKASAYKQICQENDEKGKPSFSNEKLRESEQSIRLIINDTYKGQMKKIIELKKKIIEMTEAVETDKRMFKILRDEIKLIVSEED